jgi:cell wall-associated NlpC family hydrolase
MYDFRRVGSRLAVDPRSLKLEISDDRVIELLEQMGCSVVEVDLIEIARNIVPWARYSRGVKKSDAPHKVDCSTFTAWVYGQIGIWLPRRTIQQRRMGRSIGLSRLRAGDLVFKTGRISWYDEDPRDNVGHVGIASGRGTIVHAVSPERGLFEDSVRDFMGMGEYRGTRRVMPSHRIVTLELPSEYDIETSDDLRWILLPRTLDQNELLATGS